MRRNCSTYVVMCVALVLGICSPSPAGDNKWTSNGPYGGDVIGFVFHPKANNVVFARSWQGMVFRSQNSGQSWEPLSLTSPYAGAVIRIHPDDPERILAAADRVYSSSDRGTTWVEIGNPGFSTRDTFWDVEFDPASARTLYGVTLTHGVYKSTDSGATWVQRNAGLHLSPPTVSGFPQLEVDPSNGRVLYVLLQSAKVYKSTDGTASWRLASKGLRLSAEYCLAIDPLDSRILLAGGPNGLYRSTDKGASWSAVIPGANVWSISFSRAVPGEVLIAGGTFMKSTDHGLTWNWLPTPTHLGLYSAALHPKLGGFILAGPTGEGVYRTQDDGQNWERCAQGMYDMTRQLAVSPSIDSLFAVTGRVLFQSQDRGKKWTVSSLWQKNTVPEINEVRFHPQHADLVAAATGPGPAALSTNGGKDWKVLEHADWWGNHLALDPQDSRTIYVAPRRSTGPGPYDWESLGVAKSTDQGESWVLVNKGLTDRRVSVMKIDPRSASTLMIATEAGRLSRTTDGGQHWKELSGVAGTGWISDIFYDLTESRTVWLARGGVIYQSRDDGQSWTAKNNNGAAYLAQDPVNPNTMFACGWGTVLVSADHGQSWAAFDSRGLGAFAVNDLLIDPGNRNRLFVATEQGVYSYTRKAAGNGPMIEQLLPAAGKAGDSITVNGSGFGALQGTSRVLFRSIDAGLAQSWSDTSIKVTVPNGVQTGPVTVVVLNKKSNPYEFIVVPPSGNVYPTSGPARGGTRVTILAPSGTSGTQFNVLFGSTVAGNVRFTQPNVITCDSPPGTGTVDVKVTSSVTSTTVGTFTYYQGLACQDLGSNYSPGP